MEADLELLLALKGSDAVAAAMLRARGVEVREGETARQAATRWVDVERAMRARRSIGQKILWSAWDEKAFRKAFEEAALELGYELKRREVKRA